jgi:hypothetical protein
VTFGNLAERPDLTPLFGALSQEENEKLLDRLLSIDAQLAQLLQKRPRFTSACPTAFAISAW